MREATIVKVFGLIQEKEKLTEKIQKLLGNGNGIIRVAPVEEAKPRASKSRVLQGRYMGVVRRLTVKQKKAVKAIREKNGYAAAIKYAKQLQA